MASIGLDTSVLPQELRESFSQFADLLGELAGENLLGLIAFGGRVVEDPLYAETSVRSVAVLRAFDLRMLDALATQGPRFGRQHVSAPLIMTPEYVSASSDVFPLELLEIQQMRRPLGGLDPFCDLHFTKRDVRLQCEREFKSELIQLRQGLLAAAGQREVFPQLCLNAVERTARVLRGWYYLAGREAPQQTEALLRGASELTGVKLSLVVRFVARPSTVDLAQYEAFYEEVAALAARVDTLADDEA